MSQWCFKYASTFWLDGKIPCRVIPSDHVSPKFRLIELSDGDRQEVPFWRVKAVRDSYSKEDFKDNPPDILCPTCGRQGRFRSVCEHCDKEIEASKDGVIRTSSHTWQFRFIKTSEFRSELRGEWFIDDNGNSSFADGDVGDINHEMAAIEFLVSYETLERFELLDPKDWAALPEEVKATIEPSFLQYMIDGGEAREWVVEHNNWIRVHGNNFEVWALTEESLGRIASFVQDEIWDEEQLPKETLWITELSTGAFFSISALQLINLTETGQALSSIKIRSQQHEDIQRKSTNNQILLTGLGQQRHNLLLDKIKSLPKNKQEEMLNTANEKTSYLSSLSDEAFNDWLNVMTYSLANS